MSWLEAMRQQVLESAGLATPPAGEAGAAAPAGAASGLFDGVFQMLKDHGLAAVLQKLEASGLRDVVASWVSTGANLPVTAEQISKAMDPETLAALARRAGIPVGQVSELLAKVLPGVVDRLTPQGVLAEPPADDVAGPSA